MSSFLYNIDLFTAIFMKMADNSLPAALLPVTAAFFTAACIISAVRIVSKKK